jgi:hypothetical protein
MALRMFPTWRHRWQQAQAAWTAGNLEDAAAHLAAIDATAGGAVARLAAEVAEQLARRALERAAEGALPRALSDLQWALKVGGRTPLWQQLACAVVEAALQQAIRQWAEGNVQAPRETLTTLAQASDLPLRLAALTEAAGRLELAHRLARKGKFIEAQRQLAAVQAFAPHAQPLAEASRRFQQQAQSLAPLVEQLRSALVAEAWSAVLPTSDQVLAMAPDHPLALAAQQRAWTMLGTRPHLSSDADDTVKRDEGPRRPCEAQGPAAASPADPPRIDRSPLPALPSPGAAPRPTRLMLWVDGVGSYLVLLSGQVTIGPASLAASVDLPIQADLSRRHARIVRRQEAYWLEPLRGRVEHGGVMLAEPFPLADGQELLLGGRVRLRFRQPHPLSCTARLELISGHRTVPLADGVILLAHTCILGPDGRSHVVCRDSDQPLFLTHEPGGILKCHSQERFEVDGRPWEAHTPLHLPARVTCGAISFFLEQA